MLVILTFITIIIVATLANLNDPNSVTNDLNEILHLDEVDPRYPMMSGLCCMKDHANAAASWTCDCPCHFFFDDEV